MPSDAADTARSSRERADLPLPLALELLHLRRQLLALLLRRVLVGRRLLLPPRQLRQLRVEARLERVEL